MANTSYRERRERRAQRLEEWAEKRQVKADDAMSQSHQIMDSIPIGQPILVGHHSEQRHRRDLDKAWNLMGKAVENRDKAHGFESRAANIRAAAAKAIYSDDPDAIEALEARIAALEAERDALKAFNAAARKAKGATPEMIAALPDDQRAGYESVQRHAAYQLGKFGEFPGYALSNINGNIKRNRDRLAKLRS